jgi:hypothetical protein
MKKNKMFGIFLTITTIFIVAYWASVFLGIFPVNDIVAGYKNWFMSFPLPDFYIAISCAIACYLLSKQPKLAGLFGIMAGSGLIFLGLYALSYGHNTGLLYKLTFDEMIEIGIKAYCLTAGPLFIRKSWKLLNT